MQWVIIININKSVFLITCSFILRTLSGIGGVRAKELIWGLGRSSYNVFEQFKSIVSSLLCGMRHFSQENIFQENNSCSAKLPLYRQGCYRIIMDKNTNLLTYNCNLKLFNKKFWREDDKFLAVYYEIWKP